MFSKRYLQVLEVHQLADRHRYRCCQLVVVQPPTREKRWDPISGGEAEQTPHNYEYMTTETAGKVCRSREEESRNRTGDLKRQDEKQCTQCGEQRAIE
jgi:hypothetical protein